MVENEVANLLQDVLDVPIHHTDNYHKRNVRHRTPDGIRAMQEVATDHLEQRLNGVEDEKAEKVLRSLKKTDWVKPKSFQYFIRVYEDYLNST